MICFQSFRQFVCLFEYFFDRFVNKRIGVGLAGVGAEILALTGVAVFTTALLVPRVATSVVAQIVLHVTKNDTDTVFAFGLLGPVEGVTACSRQCGR